MLLEHKLWVVALDGAAGTVYVNDGTPREPRLVRLFSAAADTPKTSDLGRDRPPRTEPGPGSRRGTYEAPDLHQRGEDRFVADFVDQLGALAREHKPQKIVLTAPPKALAVARQAVAKDLAPRIARDIAADYTKHAPKDLATALAAALSA